MSVFFKINKTIKEAKNLNAEPSTLLRSSHTLKGTIPSCVTAIGPFSWLLLDGKGLHWTIYPKLGRAQCVRSWFVRSFLFQPTRSCLDANPDGFRHTSISTSSWGARIRISWQMKKTETWLVLVKIPSSRGYTFFVSVTDIIRRNFLPVTCNSLDRPGIAFTALKNRAEVWLIFITLWKVGDKVRQTARD